MPELHLEFCSKLYEALDASVKEYFEFSVKENILLREGIFSLILKKIDDAKERAEQRSLKMAMEVYKYRATKAVSENATISETHSSRLENHKLCPSSGNNASSFEFTS